MTDTPPEIAAIIRQRLMALPPEERFLMACRSFTVARDIVIASMSKDLSEIEFKRQLFQRIYGYPLPADFEFR
jgi:hypothetical protein